MPKCRQGPATEMTVEHFHELAVAASYVLLLLHLLFVQQL